MNDTERVIGELREFKRATLSELAELKQEVKELLAFKWKATGIMAFIFASFEAVRILWDKTQHLK